MLPTLSGELQASQTRSWLRSLYYSHCNQPKPHKLHHTEAVLASCLSYQHQIHCQHPVMLNLTAMQKGLL